MKARLGHGHWRAWLQTHWPLDVSLANRWMNVARKCGQFPHLKIPRSTLYLLAADSTPDTLREEFVRRVEAGEPPLTHAELKAQGSPPTDPNPFAPPPPPATKPSGPTVRDNPRPPRRGHQPPPRAEARRLGSLGIREAARRDAEFLTRRGAVASCDEAPHQCVSS